MKTIKFRARHKGSRSGWTQWSSWGYINLEQQQRELEVWNEVSRETQDVYVTPDGMQLIEPPEDDVYIAIYRITRVTFQRQTDGKQMTQIFDHGTY